ncbi:MAG: M23 family metallopeptidase [Christensenellaceae bacterium]|nr:M23 family metallopeptidase [Christensenellaceae bacterium]
MDKKSEHKWRMKQLRLRSNIFLRKNGLYLAVIGSLAALGAAAVFIFTSGEDIPDEPVNLPNDQHLSDVQTPGVIQTPGIPHKTADPSLNIPPDNTLVPDATVTPVSSGTPMPDFTPFPELTAEPGAMQQNLQSPVDGSIIRVFAINSLIYSETLQQWMTHSGVDIASPKGSEVHAVLDGRIENIYTDDMLGVTVVISHENGMMSVYANLSEDLPVNIGDTVSERDVIGCIGDTAISECAEVSHLHFEIIVNGTPIDPQSLIVFKKEE